MKLKNRLNSYLIDYRKEILTKDIVLSLLQEYREKEYAPFQSKLLPGIAFDKVIGVRVGNLRKISKNLKKYDVSSYFEKLPHDYYEENMLHAILLSKMKDFKECVLYLNKFLPYVDNWAVCDTLNPFIFQSYKKELLLYIKDWIKSDHVYTVRFGLEMLMRYFLDEDYQKEYLQYPCLVLNKDYYVKMMIAWFYATALAKHYEDALVYLKEKRFDKWVHNKIIQKAIESYRIKDTQKEELRKLRRI